LFVFSSEELEKFIHPHMLPLIMAILSIDLGA